GRAFTLPRKAAWSDGKELTVGDLRTTLELLKKGGGAGLPAAWGGLIDRVQSDSPFHVQVLLRQGYLDPLAAMTFKVLPRHLDPESDTFARAPVGSGPFLYDAKRSRPKGSGSLTLFANPKYAARPGKAGRPRIGAVEFTAPKDPVRELKDKRLD